MACYDALPALRRPDGTVVMLHRGDVTGNLSLPCGRCIGCRIERARQWSIRCMHEASLYEDNCFITLTYDDEHLPGDGSLDYRHFQLFMKRLRKMFSPRMVRFYMCGEYGELNWRPHYHACLFNLSFREDWVVAGRSQSGFDFYRSPRLEQLWPFGFSTVSNLSRESAQYVARYVLKKVSGGMKAAHYRRVDSDGVVTQLEPEFAHMSVRPGVGAYWYQIYSGSDIDPHDRVVFDGRPQKPPRFYDRLLRRSRPELFEEQRRARRARGVLNYRESRPQRIVSRETVVRARMSRFKRSGA